MTTGTESTEVAPARSISARTPAHWSGWMSIRKAVGAFVGRSASQAGDETGLDGAHADHHHRPQPEGHDAGDGRRPRPAEGGETVAQRQRQREARQPAHERDEAARPQGEKHRGRGEAAGEGGSERERPGLHPGDERQSGEQGDRGSGKDQARRRQRFDLPAQDARRGHRECGEQRRQSEEHRDSQAQPETAQDRQRLELDLRQHREEVAGEGGYETLEGQTERDTGEAPGACQQDGLTEIDRQDLPRSSPERLPHRDRVEAAGEPGAHRLRHADAAHDEREQRDETEEAFGPVDAPPHLGLPLGGGLDAVEGGIAERAAQPRGERFGCRGRRGRRALGQFHQQPMSDPAAQGDQAG